jgi:hypothetical protein
MPKSPLNLLRELFNVKTAKEAEDALRAHSPAGQRFYDDMMRNVEGTRATGNEHAVMTQGPINQLSVGDRQSVEFVDPHLIEPLPGSNVKIGQHTHPDGTALPSDADLHINHHGAFGAYGNAPMMPRADFIHGPNTDSRFMMITDPDRARGAVSYYDLPEVERTAIRMVKGDTLPFENLHADPDALDLVASGRAYNPTGSPEGWYRDLLSEIVAPYLTQRAVKRAGAGNVVFDLPTDEPLVRWHTPLWVTPGERAKEPPISKPGRAHDVLDYLDKSFERYTGMKQGGLARCRDA